MKTVSKSHESIINRKLLTQKGTNNSDNVWPVNVIAALYVGKMGASFCNLSMDEKPSRT